MTGGFKTPLLAATVPLCLIAGLISPAEAARQAAAITLSAATGAAPSNAAPERNLYPSAYFDVFVPRTALDMVRRIPGFQIQRGDTSRRGLGQGGANILINGERLTGKTDPFDQLDQILAENVVEIRIVDGATLSIPGLSGQVADIRVERSGKLQGTWEWNPEFRERLEPNWLRGELNLSGETELAGGITYALTLREFGFRSGALATEDLFTADGELFEQRTEDIQNTGQRPGIALNLGWTPKPGHKANLNTEYSLFNYQRASRAVRIPLTMAGDDALTFGENREDEWKLEIDGDYELPFLNGQLKFIGVLDRESSPTTRRFSLTSPQTGFMGASQFEQDGQELELVGRAEYSWVPKEGQDWQIAVEGAFNELDIEQEFLSQQPGADFASAGINGFVVSEDRAEATMTHNRAFGPKWDVQLSAGVEYSKLMQERSEGETAEPREFVRPKGFISSTYSVSDSFKIRSRLEREVGQLNFFDFVASVDLEDALDRAANFDLVPSQSWLGSVEFDKDFGQGNTLRVEVYAAAISDIVDRIPIGLDGDAVGNIDSAYRYGVDIASTLKGDRWGLPGTELNLKFDWRDTGVDDPLLGFSRDLNGDGQIYYEASFRHDVPQTDWAYGAYLERFITARRYRLLSIDRNGVDRPFAHIFAEHKDVAGMTVRLTLANLLGQREFFERTRFTTRRDLGEVLQTEKIEFDYGTIVRLSVSGSF